MSTFWDDLIRRSRRALGFSEWFRALAGHVAVFPPPERRRRSRIREVVAIVLALAIIALLLQTGHGQTAAVAEGVI